MDLPLLETRDGISEWADNTFGPANRIDRIVARANEEMAELLRAVTSLDNEEVFSKIPEECADIAIVLMRAARHIGEDIDALLKTIPFGSDGGAITTHAAKANDFMSKLVLVSFGNATSPPLAMNLCGLVCLHLSDICAALNTDLNGEIHRKMNVNRAREWKLDNTGHGYHVKDPAVTTLFQPRCIVCGCVYPECSGSRTGQCNNPPAD